MVWNSFVSFIKHQKTKIKGLTIQDKNHFSELQGKCFFKVAKSKY